MNVKHVTGATWPVQPGSKFVDTDTPTTESLLDHLAVHEHPYYTHCPTRGQSPLQEQAVVDLQQVMLACMGLAHAYSCNQVFNTVRSRRLLTQESHLSMTHVRHGLCKAYLWHVEVVHKDDHLLAGRGPVDAALALVHLAVDDVLHLVGRRLRAEGHEHGRERCSQSLLEELLDVDSLTSAWTTVGV